MPSSDASLTDLLTAHNVYQPADRARALGAEIKRSLGGREVTRGQVVDAARVCIEQLDRMGRAAGDITPGLILAALGAGRQGPSTTRPTACLGCEDGVIRLMAWRDGLVTAYACDCDAGRSRVPTLAPALQVAERGTHADAHPVRLLCYDFARPRTDEASLRYVVDELFGWSRHYRPGAVLAAFRSVGVGEWPADMEARVSAQQARLDARRAA